MTDVTSPTPAGDGTDGGKGLPLGGQDSTESGKGNALSDRYPPVGGTSSNTGDGTQGVLGGDSGKGATVDPTTGLPAQAGSGSSLPFPATGGGWAAYVTASLSLFCFLAAGMVRLAGARPSGGRDGRRSRR
jgi:hypothetical protein